MASPRQYAITVAADGSMTPLLFRRTDAGAADSCTDVPTVLGIARPTTKQGGSANSTGAVEFYWSESDETPVLSTAFCLASMPLASPNGEIEVGSDLADGWLWARTASGVAVELHVTERTI